MQEVLSRTNHLKRRIPFAWKSCIWPCDCDIAFMTYFNFMRICASVPQVLRFWPYLQSKYIDMGGYGFLPLFDLMSCSLVDHLLRCQFKDILFNTIKFYLTFYTRSNATGVKADGDGNLKESLSNFTCVQKQKIKLFLFANINILR